MDILYIVQGIVPPLPGSYTLTECYTLPGLLRCVVCVSDSLSWCFAYLESLSVVVFYVWELGGDYGCCAYVSYYVCYYASVEFVRCAQYTVHAFFCSQETTVKACNL